MPLPLEAWWYDEAIAALLNMAPSAVKSLVWQNPWAFLLLLGIPIWLWFYRYQQANFLETAFKYSPLAVLDYTARIPKGFKRLLYPIWISLLIVLLAIAAARPIITGTVPTFQVNLMLVMDISLSMMADDIDPNRLDASKAAAIQFINDLPPDVSVGLELFAGNNYVVQPPTKDHDVVTAYIDTLSERHLQMRTEIGSALKTAVDLLSLNQGSLPSGALQDTNKGASETENSTQKPKQVIVLISDGDSQEGYPWSAAVAMARGANIGIYTLGIGSMGEASIVYQGHRVPVGFNENILRQIATVSGGQYFRVATANDFKPVYDQVRKQSIVMTHQREELTWLAAMVGVLWLALGLFGGIVRERT